MSILLQALREWVFDDLRLGVVVGYLIIVFGSPDPLRRVGEPVSLGLYLELVSWDTPVQDNAFNFPEAMWGQTDTFIRHLEDPTKAESAERELERRREYVNGREAMLDALVDPRVSSVDGAGPSAFRRLVRVSLAMKNPPRFQFWSQIFDRTTDANRRVILMELLCAEGFAGTVDLYEDANVDERLSNAALRGWKRANDEVLLVAEVQRSLIRLLRSELVGIPSSRAAGDPSPASLLIEIEGDGALASLSESTVLDPENPRLAENLRAMVEAEMLLPLSVHEILLQNLRESPSGEPMERDPLTPAVAMLGLRGDEASRERLRKLRDDERARLGAEQGLALMKRANEKN